MDVAVKVKGGLFWGATGARGPTTIPAGIVQNTITRPGIPIYSPVYINSQ